MRDLNRDMAAVEQAIKASMREAEEAMRNLGPALKAVDESLRSLESNIKVQVSTTTTASSSYNQGPSSSAQGTSNSVYKAEMTENQAMYTKIGYREYDRREEDGYSRVYMRKSLV